ncbi:unnamed protein product [Schistosoma margrebowiei]|uniref:Uncharacterized protein n=1 Tax=Schistosoma margrebowiei TaxID=48269 RepID=A0A3P8A438_9TREM|nr:unnamed protein product [Schistosoma margrebowiei]
MKVLNTTLQERYVDDVIVNRFLSDFRSSVNDECNDGVKKTLVSYTVYLYFSNSEQLQP